MLLQLLRRVSLSYFHLARGVDAVAGGIPQKYRTPSTSDAIIVCGHEYLCVCLCVGACQYLRCLSEIMQFSECVLRCLGFL